MGREVVFVFRNRRWRFSAPIVLLLLVYLSFVFADQATSIQTGNRGADRSLAYWALFSLDILLLTYLFFRIKSNIRLTTTLISLSALAIWGLFVNLLRQVELWTLLVHSNMSILWILAYLFFSHYTGAHDANDAKVNRFVKLIFYVFMIVILYIYFDMTETFGRIPVITFIYNILALLPWIFFRATPKEKRRYYVIVIIATFLSMKRGAIIALFMMLYLEMSKRYRLNKSESKRIFKSLLHVGAFILAFFIMDHFTSGFLTRRFSLEEMASGSGRSSYISDAFRVVVSRDFWTMLIGTGSGSSVLLLGSGIHNEWLEFLFSFGIIGLLLYTSLILGFIAQAKIAEKISSSLASSCYMSLVLYLLLSFYSTAYGSYIGFLLFGFWGYADSCAQKLLHKSTRSLS